MFHIASAEARYSAKSLLAWFTVLLTMTLWPLYENPSVDSFPTILAFMAIYLPFVAVIGNFRLLSVERNEKHLRLFRTLPVTRTQLALARLLRALALPALALVVSLALLGVGLITEGPAFLASLAGAWVLLTLLFTSVAVSILSTLLYDIGGMTFAQLSGVVLVVLTFALNASSPAFRAAVLDPVAQLAQTPPGVLLALALCILLGFCDTAVFSRRQAP